jgi:F-type H+-transporting ATPase subunit delta
MSLRASAARYARALFDVALAESDPSGIEADLAAVVGAIHDHVELARALTHPGVPLSARSAVVRAVAERLGARPPVVKLVGLLAARGRLALLPELLAAYRERLLEHRNVARASVTSAAPLRPETLQALERTLGEATGRRIHIDAEVDPDLIGGVVARVGSVVYDGSIRTQLEKMKRQLTEAV